LKTVGAPFFLADQAREAAGDVLARVRFGEDAPYDRAARRSSPMLADLITEFMNEEIRPTRKPRTADLGPHLDGIEQAATHASGAAVVVRGRLRVNVDPFFSRVVLAGQRASRRTRCIFCSTKRACSRATARPIRVPLRAARARAGEERREGLASGVSRLSTTDGRPRWR
jgi:hypothetical protein